MNAAAYSYVLRSRRASDGPLLNPHQQRRLELLVQLLAHAEDDGSIGGAAAP